MLGFLAVPKPPSESPLAQADGQPGVVLRRNYLSALENVAQSVGTMGPVATIGTVLPLLIYKSGNATWLLCLGVLAVFCLISASMNVFASRFASAGSLAAYAEAGLGPWAGSLTGWSYVVAMTLVVTSSGVSSAYYLAMVMSHFTHHPVGSLGLILLTILVVLIAWWPTFHDVKLSTNVMLAAESVSVIGIVFILGAAMMANHRWVDHSQLGLEGASFSKVQLGFVLVFMTLAGFESTTTLGEEAKTATRTLPRVMLLCVLPTGLFFVASIYCLTALSHGRNLAPRPDGRAPGHDSAVRWLSHAGVAEHPGGCDQLLWLRAGRLQRRVAGHLFHGAQPPRVALFRGRASP
jgi:amino acid transporter